MLHEGGDENPQHSTKTRGQVTQRSHCAPGAHLNETADENTPPQLNPKAPPAMKPALTRSKHCESNTIAAVGWPRTVLPHGLSQCTVVGRLWLQRAARMRGSEGFIACVREFGKPTSSFPRQRLVAIVVCRTGGEGMRRQTASRLSCSPQLHIGHCTLSEHYKL